MTAVVIEELSKTYPLTFPRLKKFMRLEVKPTVEALKNVSFEIGGGEFFGLISRNGAGKTTLTKIIATLVQPTHGKIAVKNYDSVDDEVKIFYRKNCLPNCLISPSKIQLKSFQSILSANLTTNFWAQQFQRSRRAAQRLQMSKLKIRRFSTFWRVTNEV